MTRWIFEPGHTEAEFIAMHMMVTPVRGLFKDVHGWLTFDPDQPEQLELEATIDAGNIWTGVQERDDHLRSSDFLDVTSHSQITFRATSCERIAGTQFKIIGDLTVRGTTQRVTLDAHYLGKWKTPYWTEQGNAGFLTRMGLTGRTRLNRHDFGVDWNDQMADGGIVVSREIDIRFDIEGLHEAEMQQLDVQKTG